jgi:hypothetical protein
MGELVMLQASSGMRKPQVKARGSSLLQVGLAGNAIRRRAGTAAAAEATVSGGAALPLFLLFLSVVLVLVLLGVAGWMVHPGPSFAPKLKAAARSRSERPSRDSAKLHSSTKQQSKGAAELVDPFLASRSGPRGSAGRNPEHSVLLGRMGQMLVTPPPPELPEKDLPARRRPKTAPVIEEPSTDFCEDLVVPPNSECILVVPLLPIGRNGSFSISDTSGVPVLRVAPVRGDALGGDGDTGEAYDKILPTLPPCSALSLGPSRPRRTMDKLSFVPYSGSRMHTGAMHSGSQVPLTPGLSSLQLMTADGKVLAQCRATRHDPGGVFECHLLRADGAHFGTLTSDENEDRYTLSTLNKTTLNFWGSFEHHAVNITDEAGELLATTERCNTEFDASSEYFRLRVAPGADVGLVVCSLLCIDHLGGAQG